MGADSPRGEQRSGWRAWWERASSEPGGGSGWGSGLATWGFVAALVPVLLAAVWPATARGGGEVTLPAVVDVRLDKALKAVKKAELGASHHDDVKDEDRSRRWRSSWRVINQEPAAGAVVAAGTKVRLGVRHKNDLWWPGQAPVVVPDVAGLRLDKAKAVLRKAYLRTASFDAVRADRTRKQKDDRKWIVLSQDPGVGATAGGGSVVRLGVRHQKDRTDAPVPKAPSTAAVAAVAPPPAPQGSPPGDDTTVARIIDGDTLEVAGGTRIRLIGVDTPEVSGHQGCFGARASAHLARLLPPGTALRLVYDAERHDRYGRTLAYLYRMSDGLFVNLAIARDGFGQQLTIAPNLAHAEEIRAGVADARAAGRGLWGACATTPAAAATTVRPAPAAPVLGPVTTAAGPAAVATGGCHPSYRGACLPIVSDVDCGEVSQKDIQVEGPDEYGLDADRDGIGCESRR